MKFMILGILVGLLALSTSALAQSGAATTTTTVSTPAPVPSLGRFDLESDPILWLVGEYGVDAGFGVSDRVVLGPTAMWVNYSSLDALSPDRLKGYEAGLRGTFYLSGPRFTDGWILSTQVAYVAVDYTSSPLFSALFDDSATYKAHITAFGGEAVAGYQWNYHSGLNLTLAGGIQGFSAAKSQLVSSGSDSRMADIPAFSGVYPSLRFTMGVVF